MKKMENRKYGSTEIQRLTGLSKMQVVHLTQTGVVEPFQDARGRGRRRVYSWENLIEFLICREGIKLRVENRVLGVLLHMLRLKKGYAFLLGNEYSPLKMRDLSFWELIKHEPEARNLYLVLKTEPAAKNDLECTFKAGLCTKFEIEKMLDNEHSFITINLNKIIDEADF